MSSLMAPRKNDPYKIKHKQQHKNKQKTKTQQVLRKILFLVFRIFLFLFYPGFQRKPGYCNAEVCGGRAGVNFWFPLNNFSLLWPIDTKLAVLVAYIKM